MCLVLFFLIPLPHLPSNQIQLLCVSAFTKSFFVSLHRCIFNGASGKRLCCVRRAALQLEPCRTGAKTAREVGQSERTPWILSRTAAVTSCACVMCVRIVVSRRSFPSFLFLAVLPTVFVVTRTAEPFRLRLAAGTKGVTLLRYPRRGERSCLRDFVGLSLSSLLPFTALSLPRTADECGG